MRCTTQMGSLESSVQAQQALVQQVAPSVQQQVQALLGTLPTDQRQLRRDMEAAVQAAMQPYKDMVRCGGVSSVRVL